MWKIQNQHEEETHFPGTNVTYISIILSSDDFKLLGHSNGWNQCSGFGLKFSIQNLHHEKKGHRCIPSTTNSLSLTAVFPSLQKAPEGMTIDSSCSTSGMNQCCLGLH